MSKLREVHNPSKMENIPINAPPIAICSGELLKRLAAETGIIKRDVTSRIPIIFMDKAITAATRSMKEVAHLPRVFLPPEQVLYQM